MTSEQGPSKRIDGSAVARHRGKIKVTDTIISELRADIASGNRPLGSRLPKERDLADQFGVSQPTIREAIRALDAMGLVDVRHGSGVYVSGGIHDLLTTTLNTVLQVEQVGMIEALDVREVLGLYSAQLTGHNATEADIATVTAAAAACDAARQVQEAAEAVVVFQVAFSAAAHNPLLFAIESFLIKLLMQFQLMAEADRGDAFWQDQTAKFSGARRRLVKGLSARDSPRTVTAMKAYLSKQRTWFSEDPDTAAVRMSDPSLIRALENILLDIPDLRPTPSS